MNTLLSLIENRNVPLSTNQFCIDEEQDGQEKVVHFFLNSSRSDLRMRLRVPTIGEVSRFY